MLQRSKFNFKKFIELNPYFFESKQNLIERHNKLGKFKNQSFSVNKNSFQNIFSKLYIKNKDNANKYKTLLKLHQAYELSKGGNIKNKKIIFINTHLPTYTKEFIKLINYKNIEIIYSFRNPLSSLSSTIKNWLNYKNGNHFAYSSLFFHFNLIFKGFEDIKKMKKKTFVVQLENLHRKNDLVMKSFCKLYSLKNEKCLKKSTYHGLLWWGDEISEKYINGINKKYTIKYNKNFFFNRDIIFFESLSKYINKKYGYPITVKNRKIIFLIFFQ